jgi:hypothetical protein
MTITSSKHETRECPCGCAQPYSRYSGLMNYGEDSFVAFLAAHLYHADTGPHLWTALGSGPWIEGDDRGCWVVLHAWFTDEGLITRIEDPGASPFRDEDVLGERLLSRAEVLNHDGGKGWAIERHLQFRSEHEPTSLFLKEVRMSADQVAEISPAIREVLAGGPDLCATFEIAGDAASWVQYSDGVVNAAYPHATDPRAMLAAIGDLSIEELEWEPGKYLSVKMVGVDARGIAKWIDQYFAQVLRAKPDYAVDVSIVNL